MPTPFNEVVRDIDEANASDPRREIVDGIERPVELVYSERMTRSLADLYPEASDNLRIAARGQHICRWQIPRAQFPLGREGYNSWRAACREHHATLVSGIMERRGYGADDCRHVASIIRKQHIKSDAEAQALENVVGVVFVRYYLDDFVKKNSDYSAEKLRLILRKTIRKMDTAGIAALGELTLPDHLSAIVASVFGPAEA